MRLGRDLAFLLYGWLDVAAPSETFESQCTPSFSAPSRRISWSSNEHASFDGRAAVITGGASGIGLALAHQLLGVGANVLVVDRDAAAHDRALSGMDAKRAIGVQADVAVASDVQRYADTAVQRLRPHRSIPQQRGDRGASGLAPARRCGQHAASPALVIRFMMLGLDSGKYAFA